jgi:hypothetical protein
MIAQPPYNLSAPDQCAAHSLSAWRRDQRLLVGRRVQHIARSLDIIGDGRQRLIELVRRLVASDAISDTRWTWARTTTIVNAKFGCWRSVRSRMKLNAIIANPRRRPKLDQEDRAIAMARGRTRPMPMMRRFHG